MFHRSTLVSKLNVDDPAVMARVHAIQQGFVAKGTPPNTALQWAYKALDYTINAQASVLSFKDVFYYLGIIFLIAIPFVLFVKRNKQKMDLSEAMH
jgi:MFS transporter, DHA2 family, multidrug resistance protein